MDKFGLTENGFKKKRYEDILSNMESKAKELFGENINLSERSPLGMFLKTISWELKDAWQTAEDVYNSAYIDSSEGISQDNVSKYIAITRKEAQKAKGVVTIKGRENTVIPKGFRVATDLTSILYETVEEVVIPTLGQIDIPIVSIETGEKTNVPANTITKIVNPIAGVSEVTNTKQTEGGTDTEKDYQFRERYYRSVSRAGSSTRESVEAGLLDLLEVEDAFVEENTSMIEVNGVPAKSLAPYVFGGDNDIIANVILKTKAGGIRSFGTTEMLVKDSKGTSHTIGFTRPTVKNIYIKLIINKVDDYIGDNEVKQAIIEYVGGQDLTGKKHRGLRLGENVALSKIIAVSDVRGVKDVEIQMSTDNITYLPSNITIGTKEIARTSWDKVLISYV